MVYRGGGGETNFLTKLPTSFGTRTKTNRQADRQTDRQTDRKLARYEKEKHPGGLSVRVVPLVLEHFGRWGKKAETYLDDLLKRSKNICNV